MKTKLKLFLISCFLILGSSVFAQTHWTAEPANTDLEAMNFSIRVSINGEVQNRVGLEVAAFCDGHIRGVATTAKVGPIYRAAIVVKHDRPDVMTRFKMYDPNTGIEYISTYEVPFTDGGSLGSNTTPIDVNFIQSPYDPTTIYGFDENMTVASFISIDGTEQLRTDLQMAIYSGEQLRGFGVPVLNSQGTLALCQVLVWGNTNGEPLTYHLYDPTLGEELLFDGQIKDPNINYQESDLLPMTFKIDGVYGNNQRIVVNFKRNIVTYIAQIGVIKYLTLNDAVDAVQNGQTITVISDFSQTEAVEFPAGMNLTLDLNGYDVEVSGEGSITVSGNLTLVDNAVGASFTTTESNFIINEGAQFYHTMANINATAIRNIEQTTDGWDGIASPMTTGSILNIETNGINELYYYDETGSEQNGLEWVAMAETSDNSYTLNEAGRGYLYANSVDPNQPQYPTSFSYDFNDGSLDGWRLIDEDGDGNNWEVGTDKPGVDGTACIYSYSYDRTALNPNNYIVTSEKYTITNGAVLEWNVKLMNDRYTDKYAVVISTDNESFSIIYEERPTESEWGADNKSIDLSDYAGQDVYVGFRHYDSNGLEGLCIDDISLMTSRDRSNTNVRFTNLTSFSYDFNDGSIDGWRLIDEDGDGNNWEVGTDKPGVDGTACIYSYSYDRTALNPNNYIVTSEKYTITNGAVLEWNVKLMNDRYTDKYAVVISTDNESFSIIYEERPTESEWGADNKSIDLSDYAGQDVYVGFRHYDSNGLEGLCVDNVQLIPGENDDEDIFVDGAILNFAGVLNHEDVSYDLTYTDSQLLKGFHLLGNPFAHNINVMNVWNETLANGYYAISNRGEWLARSTDNVAEVIAPMEAFLIKAGEAGKLTIRKSAGAKRSSSNGSLMISVTNGELRDDAYVSFNAGIGLDKISHRNENAPMLYIPAQDKNYAVAVMDKEVKEIPLSFEAKQMGQYTISAEALNCEFEELYLIDKQTGTTTNLNLEDYTFIARTGDDEERFVITKSLSGTNPESHDESFIYIDNGDLVVKNIEGEGHVRVFDVLGRPVAEFMAVESARISTERFGNGIYVIQMSDENGVKVQKILID